VEFGPEPAQDEVPPVAEALSRRPVYQPSLFTTSRVVAFESFAPESVEAPVKMPLRSRQKARKIPPGQQSFGFEPESKQYPTRYQSPEQPMEPMIGCDAPVAVTTDRMVAAALDISMVIIGVAMFLLVFRLAGGTIVLNKYTAPWMLGIACILFLLYKTIWCFADGDTAGMRWAGLRLVDFDGKPPEREQRLYRMAAGFLSLLAAGLGLLWALVDEESLTWHDHISKTFPTPF